MSNVTLMQGDCLDKLKELDDNSVDSIVTDPPYGLSFMGKAWDKAVPSVEVWEECLRVLKPGGHLLSFAGTRTQHRMAVNIEDAGFEIRDIIAWVYGCLSEDTEIATPDGTKPYTAINTGDLVLCYDKYTQEYTYQPVENVYEYNIKDTAYRIQSDYTDQVVSRNHRCLVERGGREVFILAEELETQENIPFLEDLSGLQETISGTHKRTSNQKQGVFKGVFQSNYWKKKLGKDAPTKSSRNETSHMFGVWDSVLQKQEAFGSSKRSGVLPSMQWGFAGGRIEKTCVQRKETLATRVRNRIKRKDDGRNKPGMERRSNIQTPKRESRGSTVCKMSSRVFGHGKKGRLHNGAPIDGSTDNKKTFVQNRSSAPYQSRSIRQSRRESDVVCEQQRPQAIRSWTGHKTTLATVTPFEYEGKIWCVKVPTGSFVAVRNGKAFTTGNSGFPKSQNVSKAIDKAAGAERKVVGKREHPTLKDPNKTNEQAGASHGRNQWSREWNITDSATDAAKQWDGWGTALKPALEPITVARKPLTGTVAANVMEHGTGAINIDGCRVGNNPRYKYPNGPGGSNENTYGKYAERGPVESTKGRFPANLIHDGSDEVVELFPNTKSGSRKPGEYIVAAGQGKYGDYGKGQLPGITGNSGSAARFFYCPKANKKDRNEGLENTTPQSGTGDKGNGLQRVCSKCGISQRGSDECPDEQNCPKEWVNPPKKNNHPTVKPTELMKYLCRLVTPPGGTVLDPFMGSGSTGKAARLEGFGFVGIELDPEYVEIARARIGSDNLSDFFDFE